MGQYFARIVRAVIVSALGFGGGTGLLVFIAILVTTGRQDALEIATRAALVIGIGFGAVLAAVLLLSDLTSRLFVAQGKYNEIWDLEQSRVMEVAGSLRDIRRYCRESLMAVPNIKVVSTDEELAIKASTGASWRSPSELMEISINQKSDDLWELKCSSRSLASHIAFDYAKNFENVETWSKTMRRLIEHDKLTPGHQTTS